MAFLDKAGLEHLWAQIVNQLNTKEDLDSKTTIISETSTNAQYPGAKAVYDFVTASIPDTSTFAKIADLTDGAMTVKFAEVADSAVYAAGAGSAINDGDGNDITGTYATKTQLTDGSVTKVGTSTVGSSTKPIYLNAGVPTEGTYTLGAACAKSVSDSSSASALSSTDTNVPTVRDIYYGLPKFNNDHTYTSTKSFYAPESGGTDGYYLKSNGPTTAPSWIDPGRRSWFGTCETEASTAEKTVTCNGFVLEAGAKISVYFKYNNTAGIPTLNVNGTGAKEIRASYQLQDTQSMRWYPGQIVEFVYYGNDWILQQPVIARTDYYGVSKVESLSMNGSSKVSPSFYAPESAGTSGYFLKSNGSGKAPTWVDLPGTWTLSDTGIWLSENLSNPQTGHVILPYNATYNFIINFGITKANTNQSFSKSFSRVLFAFTTTDHTSDHLSQRSHITALTTKGITLGDNSNVWVRWFVGGLVSKS